MNGQEKISEKITPKTNQTKKPQPTKKIPHKKPQPNNQPTLPPNQTNEKILDLMWAIKMVIILVPLKVGFNFNYFWIHTRIGNSLWYGGGKNAQQCNPKRKTRFWFIKIFSLFLNTFIILALSFVGQQMAFDHAHMSIFIACFASKLRKILDNISLHCKLWFYFCMLLREFCGLMVKINSYRWETPLCKRVLI